MKILHFVPLLLGLIFAFSPAAAQDAEDTGWALEERCIGEPTHPPNGWTFPGAILMTGHYGIHAVSADVPTPYVVAFVPSRPQYGAENINMVLSPDQRWLAVPHATVFNGGLWVALSVYEITVFSTVTPRESYTIPWIAGFYGYGFSPRWIDNQHLIYPSPGIDFSDNEFHSEETYRINPFTQETEIYSEIKINPFLTNSFFSSPDWTRAVYDQQWFDYGLGAAVDWGVYNPINGDQLALLPLTLKNPIIEWLPDSTQFVAETERSDDEDELIDQLEMFDRDGATQGIIFLETNGQRIRITFNGSRNIRWSPDGRYLAFITTTLNYPTVISLYIADMQEKRVYDTCIEPGDGLAWSPDGTQLAMMDFYDYKAHRPVMVLDMETWGLYTVAYHDGSVIGWRGD